ncbi:MAG: carbamoyl phosphate synthase large subunit, partial [Nitrospira sp.]
TLDQLGFTQAPSPSHVSVKEAVFPFMKFSGVDVLLGPEMKSTGEVMGMDADFGWAFAKSQSAAGVSLPRSGTVLLSVKGQDKPAALAVAQQLHKLGFRIEATQGTAAFFLQHGVECTAVKKVGEGRPHLVDHIKNGEISLVVNTVWGQGSQTDSASIRRESLQHGVSYYTTMPGARAATMAIEAMLKNGLAIRSLQEYHEAQ